ncbi:MAG: hypothetical protein M0R32_02605 [Candidatus Cloacimonetes bacterium]|jgi:hypothetical protein|nr:hypothetical protein [Candidatus Cloacimonadota bacterium]
MKTKEPTPMFQIQACDNAPGPYANHWLAYDGAEFDEARCDAEVAGCNKQWPRYTYKKIPSGSCGGSKKQISYATQNYERPMQEVLKGGDDMEIQSRFDQNARNADTGILYMPSQRWAVTLLHPNGSVCTVGGDLKTKASAEDSAKRNADQHLATCWVFSRKQTGCKLVSVHYWDDKNQFVISKKVKL